MTSKIKVNILADGGDNSIITSDGAGAVTFGTSGDSITIPSGVTITNNGTQTGFGGENTPAFKVYLTSAQSIPRSSFTKVQFNTTSGNNNTGWNVESGFDTTNYRFTCPSGKSGKYYFSVSLLIEYASVLTNYGYIRWYKNGSAYANFRQGMNSGGLEYSFTSNTIIDLSDSDYVEVYISQESSDSENIDANSSFTWFEGFKLIGA